VIVTVVEPPDAFLLVVVVVMVGICDDDARWMIANMMADQKRQFLFFVGQSRTAIGGDLGEGEGRGGGRCGGLGCLCATLSRVLCRASACVCVARFRPRRALGFYMHVLSPDRPCSSRCGATPSRQSLTPCRPTPWAWATCPPVSTFHPDVACGRACRPACMRASQCSAARRVTRHLRFQQPSGLVAEADGACDIAGMKVGGRQQLAARAPSWDPSHFYSAGFCPPSSPGLRQHQLII
jgi:hypothetical protein